MKPARAVLKTRFVFAPILLTALTTPSPAELTPEARAAIVESLLPAQARATARITLRDDTWILDTPPASQNDDCRDPMSEYRHPGLDPGSRNFVY